MRGVTKGQRDQAETMGYSICFIRILDSGGTIFTDALLHVSQILTCVPFYCENDAYRLVGENNGFRLYDSAYILPFAIAIPSDITTRGRPTDLVQAHNMYYEAISGEQKAIMSKINEGKIYVDGKKALYITGSSAERITVNGVVLPVPTIGKLQNVSYPEEFNCNLLFAGIHENESVEIEGMENLAVYSLDLEAMGELYDKLKDEETHAEAKGNSLSIEISGDEERDMVLIPISYDSGFKAMVNGKRSDVINIDDMFIGVPIEQGKNHVELRFVPRGLCVGLVVSMICLILTVFFTLRPMEYRTFYEVGSILFGGAWGIALTILYIIPVIAFVIHQIVKRLSIFGLWP